MFNIIWSRIQLINKKFNLHNTSLSLIVTGFIIFIIYVNYINNNNEQINYNEPLKFTSRYTIEQMKEFAYKNLISISYKPSLYKNWNFSFNKIFENTLNRFNVNATDVIVFIHIQKTAGTTFEKFLVKHLNISRQCDCNMGKKCCNCYRSKNEKEIWLFSRYSTGWACGLHADFTELFVSGCVDQVLDKKEGVRRKRRYFYTTFLRDPVDRFISEYSHVERGANWLKSRHVCNGKPPTPAQLPLCFNPDIGWEGVSLDEFLACPYNLAFNRQTRMLADLTLVNCYNWSTMNKPIKENIMLKSAKTNLKNLAFFGIKERMNDSQFLFEKTFNLKFTKNLAEWNISKSQNKSQLYNQQIKFIKQLNSLDIELYKFAIKLFNKRLTLLKQVDNIKNNFSNKFLF